MKCYVCAKEGKDTEVCGMGLCEDHIVHEELEVWTGGYPFPAEKLDETLPRILCQRCYNAIKAAEK